MYKKHVDTAQGLCYIQIMESGVGPQTNGEIKMTKSYVDAAGQVFDENGTHVANVLNRSGKRIATRWKWNYDTNKSEIFGAQVDVTSDWNAPDAADRILTNLNAANA